MPTFKDIGTVVLAGFIVVISVAGFTTLNAANALTHRGEYNDAVSMLPSGLGAAARMMQDRNLSENPNAETTTVTEVSDSQ